MRTDALVALLAGDAGRAKARAFGPRLLIAALAGAAISTAVLAVWLGFRPLMPAMHSSPFWMKVAYTALLAAAALIAAVGLARPGGRIGAALLLGGVTVAWLAMMAGHETMRAAPGDMPRLWMGVSWSVCPFRILALAAPVFAVVIWAMRRAAPTRPTLAGAAAGLFAGAVGATVYGLYCQEATAAFVVTWYSLGLAACAAIGAAVGTRLLRW
ncbi:MAG TPA: DUF1109 domain-containing protein [Caulobacteraceae bacterium]|nr:DUF1109 domain-containing protein [Caulobacteraceae bacterium]